MRKLSIIKEANAAFAGGDFKKAEVLYADAISKHPWMRKSLEFNLAMARKRIVKLNLNETKSEFKTFLVFGILTPPHTISLAQAIKFALLRHGWRADILTASPSSYEADFYFVLAPQVFEHLPPGEKRIVYQLEQTTSQKWMTQNYFDILQSSLAMLEYSIFNIESFLNKSLVYPHVFHLPVNASIRVPDIEVKKDIDVLFYGDNLSSGRRQFLLDSLGEKYRVKIVNNSFGEDAWKLILRSRLVLNLHYHDDAILETPRISECIELMVPIVSEMSIDQPHHTDYHGCVRYFKQGSVPEMLESIAALIECPPSVNQFMAAKAALDQSFDFFFDRMLLGIGILPKSTVNETNLTILPVQEVICLSMPETIQRRKHFLTKNQFNAYVFDGLRARPSWIGCGLSYKALALHGLRHNLNRLTVMEDDVELPFDIQSKLDIVHEYLNIIGGGWDLFSGLIAVLNNEVEISAVALYKNLYFITINKMTSMVFNIYSANMLKILSHWNPMLSNSEVNTIDKYIESFHDLRVIVALPFLVGHSNALNSSLWGFNNAQYDSLIKESEQLLKIKVNQFLVDTQSDIPLVQ